MSKVYRHYGSNKFDRNHGLCSWRREYKPDGLWASPVDAPLTWYDWCVGEEFRLNTLETYFDFTLAPGAKILEIHKLEDIVPFLRPDTNWAMIPFSPEVREDDPTYGFYLDHSKLKAAYDGMEVFMSDDYISLHGSQMFNTYDVDSLVLWNLDLVQIVKEEAAV